MFHLCQKIENPSLQEHSVYYMRGVLLENPSSEPVANGVLAGLSRPNGFSLPFYRTVSTLGRALSPTLCV